MFDEKEKLSPHYENKDYQLFQEACEKCSCGLLDGAERIFSTLSAKYPNDSVVKNNYGVCLFKNGKIKNSILQFSRPLDLDPKYKDALSNINKACKVFSEKNDSKHVFNHLDTLGVLRSFVISGIECFEGWAVSEFGIESIKVYVDDKFLCCCAQIAIQAARSAEQPC